MNNEMVIKRVEPYLVDKNSLYNEDFEKIFSELDRYKQYKVIDVLIKNNIEIIYDKKPNIKIEPLKNLSNMTNEELAVMYQKGNKEALDELYLKNKKFIYKKALRYHNFYNQDLSIEDLVQEGFFGLMKAAKKYKIETENKFITYAGYWINQTIIRAISNDGFAIRIPSHMLECINKVRKSIIKHNIKNDYLQKYDLIKQEINISFEKYELSLKLMENVLKMSSIDKIVGEEMDSKVKDFIADEKACVEKNVMENCLKKDVEDTVSGLSERERAIIEKRFGFIENDPMTLERIAREYGLTRERIRQIESKTLTKLKYRMKRKELQVYLEEEYVTY